MAVGPTKEANSVSLGHKKGASAVREVIEEAARQKIKFLTLFTFSTENWSRPEDEVGVLMRLLLSSLKKEFNRSDQKQY